MRKCKSCGREIGNKYIYCGYCRPNKKKYGACGIGCGIE